jgi:lysozyme
MPKPTDFTDLINTDLRAYHRGMDISHYNTGVNWNALSHQIEFCYIKLTEGRTYADPLARQHVLGARSVQIPFGFYHFARPETVNSESVADNARAQVSFALGRMAALPGNPGLPFCLDLEGVENSEGGLVWDTNLNPEEYLLWVHTFISGLTNPVLRPQSVVIYSRADYLNKNLPSTHDLGRYPLWLARYTNDQDAALPATGWESWDIWQFTDAGNLSGDGPNAAGASAVSQDLDLWRIDRFPHIPHSIRRIGQPQ